MSREWWSRALGRLPLVVSALGALGCASSKPTYTLSATSDAIVVQTQPQLPKFLVFADTQYSLPATDYDLRPDLSGFVIQIQPGESAKKASTFYRNAAANAVLPDALDSILTQAENDGHEFAVFAGDLVEFACVAEAERMFAVLEAHPKLPVLIALGNHDVLFHGSWDTDAVRANGSGAWDENAWNIWGYVCAQQGGRLTKETFIRRVAQYYSTVFGFRFPLSDLEANSARSTADEEDPLPLLKNDRWSLEYGIKLSAPNVPTSHRQSHLFQRFTYQGKGSTTPATVTLLDTVDYSDRRTLCDKYGMLLQLGMSGSMSVEQLRWLERIGTPGQPHFIAGHYLPYAPIADHGGCDATAGTGCKWARGVLADYSQGAVTIYGHVHKPYEEEELAQDTGFARQVVRVPSLIDNKSYVTFDGRNFKSVDLEPNPAFVSEAPFTKDADTCTQRMREVAEFGRNLACFMRGSPLKAPKGWPAAPTCQDLDAAQEQLQGVAAEVCKSPGDFAGKACQAPDDEAWRCAVRTWLEQLLDNLPSDRRGTFARQQLQAAHTLRAK